MKPHKSYTATMLSDCHCTRPERNTKSVLKIKVKNIYVITVRVVNFEGLNFCGLGICISQFCGFIFL